MKKYPIYIMIAIILIGILIWRFGLYNAPMNSPAFMEYAASTSPARSDSSVPVLGQPTPASDTRMDALAGTYVNPKYSFSFKYPKGYTVSSFADQQDEKADIILVQNRVTHSGLQIHAETIDENIYALTVERIRKDLPDLKIDNPTDTVVGSGTKIGKGVSFISDDQAFGGKSREVWFVSGKVFYQMRTYEIDEPLVQAIIGSWKFF